MPGYPHSEDWPWSSALVHLSGRDNGLVEEAPVLFRIGDWRKCLAGIEAFLDDYAMIKIHNRDTCLADRNS